jgi:hypothetical protein
MLLTVAFGNERFGYQSVYVILPGDVLTKLHTDALIAIDGTTLQNTAFIVVYGVAFHTSEGRYFVFLVAEVGFEVNLLPPFV